MRKVRASKLRFYERFYIYIYILDCRPLSLFSFLVRSFFEEGPGGRLFARNIGVIVIVVAVSPGRYCHLAL